MVKIKWDNAKHSLSITRKTPFLCFSFSYTFSHFFNQKLFICIHLSFFMHTIPNSIIFSSSNITYWKSETFFVKVQSTLCWWNSRPLSQNEVQNFYKLYQGNAYINCKTHVSTERWKSRVEFHGKNHHPWKNFKQNFMNFLKQNFMSCKNLNKSVSLFHTQFILDLFFFTQFQSHCVYKLFLIQKSNYGTNLNRKKGKQEETTIY